ncbi:MAG TPA: protein-L-isoaspartate(D-aspartate) O-methyltransferase [Vicinamibacterales bacterium]|nr:protein-L-isoaspartate(D-aspartate) O-methyltransferase [Acidobacteriota bacterium]HOC19417.1 protein-L-isoaspartate(D-aspartate) O-methyltransferase [Vicinamibacterales bacterium]
MRGVPLLLGLLLLGGCARAGDSAGERAHGGGDEAARERMVSRQLEGRDITDRKVLEAMRAVPRHLFVPPDLRDRAYDDTPLPIGHGQTISQPYIVALMTQLVRPGPADRALEIGTGSGYQAAILARLVQEVYSIEIVEPLAREAEERLRELGFGNVTVRAGDGYRGWPERAPFDIVMVTAAPDHLPPALLEQLGPGGRLVIPIGPRGGGQVLRLFEKDREGRVASRDVAPVLFVPLVRAGAPAGR